MSDTPPTKNPDAGEPTEDEAHRKFREALDRKKHAQHASAESAGGQAGVGPSNNTKTTRQFRRKSGS